MPGHSRSSSGSQRDAADARAGSRRARARIAASVSARRSQDSSPRPGTTLNASPACSTVGTAVRCSGPSGAWRAATACAAAASASSALRPRSGAEPECAARPARVHLDRPGRLAPHDDALARRPASARRPRSTGTRPSRRSARRARTAPCATPRRRRAAAPPRRSRARRAGERAQRAEREHDAALHVDRAGAEQVVAVAPQRLVVRVGDDGVDVAEQQDPAPRRAAQRGRAGRARGRARSTAGARPRASAGSSAAQTRGALLRAVDVARRRRDGDERLELALGAPRDRRRPALDPAFISLPNL